MWIASLLLPAGAFMVGFMAWMMHEQLIAGRPFGNHPMPDGVLVWFGPLYILLGCGLVWLYFAAELITEVRPDGIHVRFRPFQRSFRHIPIDDVSTCEARKYSPIREYGGWGIRVGPGGRAYNVYGNRGVQLVLLNGTRLLIGSQAADAMADAVRSIKR